MNSGKALKWVAILAAGLSGGCALIPVAALGVAGNVADIGSAAFSAGTEVFAGGKLESIEFCTFANAHAAARSMANDLRLRASELKRTKTDVVYRLADEHGAEIDLSISRRTAALCALRIDVGYFGSEAYARLLLKSVRARLPAASARPATRPVAPVDLNAPRTYGDFGSTQPVNTSD